MRAPAPRGWTLLLIPDRGAGPVVQKNLTRSTLHLAAGGLALGVVTLLFAAALVGWMGTPRKEDDRLLEENLALRARLATLDKEMDQADDAIRRIRIYERRLKELSKNARSGGLGPLDEDDFQAFNDLWGPEPAAVAEAEGEEGEEVSGMDLRPAEIWAQSVQARIRRIVDLVEEMEPRMHNTEDDLEEWRSTRSVYPAFWPVGGTLSSAFGYRRSPFNGRWKFHAGIDIAADRGVTIVCPAPGYVTFSGYNGAYGRMVEVDHGYGLRSRYAHNSALFVKEGDVVDRGDALGTVGSSGRTTGPHLHFEILVNGRQVDPMDFLPPFHR